MALFVQREGAGRPLVCLHGWGFHGGVWEGVSRALAGKYQVCRVDLPGHGRSAMSEDASLAGMAAQLAETFPEPAVWLGWSLGGLLALQVALAYPQQVSALALVAATPRFVRADDWPHATAPEVLANFAGQLENDGPATLQRFLSLQVRGGEAAREQLRGLRALLAAHPPQPAGLRAGLRLLAESDLRRDSARLACPALLCLGERDTLVPAAMARDWQPPGARSAVIAGAAHVPFLSHPPAFIAQLESFLDDC